MTLRLSVIVRKPPMLTGKTAVVTGSTSGIGLGIARSLAASGANILLNGFGDAAAIEETRAELAREAGVKVIYSGADMSKPAEIAAMMKLAETELGPRRHPHQQCRHPARRSDRGLSHRQVGRHHRHHALGGVPHDPPCRAGHEAAELGTHRQYRLGPCAGRLALQIGLRRRQARSRRLDQDRRPRSRRRTASPSMPSAPAMS